MDNGEAVDTSGQIRSAWHDRTDQAPGSKELSTLLATNDTAKKLPATNYYRFARGFAPKGVDAAASSKLSEQFASADLDIPSCSCSSRVQVVHPTLVGGDLVRMKPHPKARHPRLGAQRWPRRLRNYSTCTAALRPVERYRRSCSSTRPGGVEPNLWHPTQTGANFTLPEAVGAPAAVSVGLTFMDGFHVSATDLHQGGSQQMLAGDDQDVMMR